MTHKMKGKRNGSTHKIRSKLDGLATRTHLLFSLKTLYFLVIAHSVIQSFYVFGIKYHSQAKNMADSWHVHKEKNPLRLRYAY